jgi:hypothetical protein
MQKQKYKVINFCDEKKWGLSLLTGVALLDFGIHAGVLRIILRTLSYLEGPDPITITLAYRFGVMFLNVSGKHNIHHLAYQMSSSSDGILAFSNPSLYFDSAL